MTIDILKTLWNFDSALSEQEKAHVLLSLLDFADMHAEDFKKLYGSIVVDTIEGIKE